MRWIFALILLGLATWYGLSRPIVPAPTGPTEEPNKSSLTAPPSPANSLKGQDIWALDTAIQTIHNESRITPSLSQQSSSGSDVLEYSQALPLQTVPLRDNQGKLLLMNQAQGVKACSDRGMHLPTAQELAKIIQSRGGKGLLEAGKGESTDGYGRVIAKNFDGEIDDFYYSNDGYKAPPGDIGDLKTHAFLSSSVDANPENPAYPPCILELTIDRYGKGFITCSGFYSLEAKNHVPDQYADNHSAILCVQGK